MEGGERHTPTRLAELQKGKMKGVEMATHLLSCFKDRLSATVSSTCCRAEEQRDCEWKLRQADGNNKTLTPRHRRLVSENPHFQATGERFAHWLATASLFLQYARSPDLCKPAQGLETPAINGSPLPNKKKPNRDLPCWLQSIKELSHAR